MPRIRLTEQDQYRFRYEQLVNLSNINMAGHVGSVEMTDLLQDARYRMMKSIGCSDLDLGDGTTGAVMADMVVNFRGEVFIDETVAIEMDIAEIDEKGYRVFYRILKNDKTAALAETGFVTFMFREKKTAKVPEVFIEKLKSVTSKRPC